MEHGGISRFDYEESYQVNFVVINECLSQTVASVRDRDLHESRRVVKPDQRLNAEDHTNVNIIHSVINLVR